MTAETTATIKAGKGYEAAWLVFKGTPAEVRAQLVESFELDESVRDLTLAELTSLASHKLQSIGNVSAKLGAVPISHAQAAAAQPAAQPAAQESSQEPPWDTKPNDPWANVEGAAALGQGAAQAPAPAPAEPAGDPVVEAIKHAADLNAIQKLWLDHKADFNRPEVQQAVAERRQQLGA